MTKRENIFILGKILAVLAVFFILIFTYSEISDKWNMVARYKTCYSNLKQLHQGFLMYSMDYDDVLPPDRIVVDFSKTIGWADLILLKIQSNNYLLHCPISIPAYVSRNYKFPNRVGFSDYWYNSTLSGVKSKSLRPTTILLGEGGGEGEINNSSYSYNVVPGYWPNVRNTPLRRHIKNASLLEQRGYNILNIDGSIVFVSKKQSGLIAK